jgi:RNA polymerase sigma factor (sigma-70 family)
MRRILVDYERRRRKRLDGRLHRTSLPDLPDGSSRSVFDLLELDDALTRLAELSPRQARILELRCFGLSVEEVAEAVGISARTVKKDTALAHSWLRRALSSW